MLPLALAVFFASGFAALLYQVVWQRMLVIFAGADVYSATIIVAAFMAGLGAGSLAGGHIADRLSRRGSLVAFGVAELAVAGFGVFSTALYYDFLYQRIGPMAAPPAVMAATLFASLLWPTFFMGMSLPLLARGLTASLDRAAATVGSLYGFNTLGAAAGAMLSTWWLLPRLGLEQSLYVGAALNLAAAAAVLPLAQWSGRPTAPSLNRPPVRLEGSASRLQFSVWALIYGLSGLLALSLEIVWFRLLAVMMKSTAFTFGTLLGLYLTGLGLGAVAGSALAARVRRPAALFLGFQGAIGLSAACLLGGGLVLLERASWLSWLRSYFASYDPLSVPESVDRLRWFAIGLSGAPPPWEFLALYFVLPAVLVLPPTFLMGCSFPLLQSVVHTDLDRLGRRVGTLILANIAGSLVGTVLTGWLWLSLFGTAGTLKLLAALSGLFVLLAAGLALDGRALRLGSWGVPPLGAAAGAAAMVLAPVVALLPDARILWASLHGAGTDRIIFSEDGSGLSVIRAEQPGFQGQTVVFVNGIGQSVIPYGEVHTALGALPAFLHHDPKDALIIGLGSGDTVYAAAGRPEIERIACIEILRAQLPTLRELSRRKPYSALRALLEDPRITHLFGDGRAHLMHSDRAYDIIEADALRPSSAYSGNLYSEEYFRLVRDRLKPEGLAATWSPTGRVHNAFVRVFPHVVSVPGILIGSNKPIEIDWAIVMGRLADPRVREHYQRAGIDIEAMLSFYLAEPAVYGPGFDRDALTDFNTDLFPKDEFDISPPRR